MGKYRDLVSILLSGIAIGISIANIVFIYFSNLH